MTVDEFAIKVAEELRAAYNSKNSAGVTSAIDDADRSLDTNKISEAGRARFWELVRQRFRTGQLLFEKQENSSLHALMRSIEAAIAARKG